MPVVYLGNPAPLDRGQPMPDQGERVTTVTIPDSRPTDAAVRDIAHNDGSPNAGLWASHSAAQAPTWVQCPDDPALEAALAARFGCPAGRPH